MVTNGCLVKGIMLAVVAVVLQACSSGGGYGYGDGPPPRDIDVSNIPDAVPKVEPITKAGNPNPYTVMGKTYHLLPVGAAYKERGTASWYGNKFHGRKTSNGETYNMYGMTAAHKTLRIPAYVRVTNLENNRSVIVRVNDRGPFHGNRIIDLSYAAAKKLGYVKKGTARVEVEAVDPRTYNRNQNYVVSQPQSYSAPAGRQSARLDTYRFELPGNTYLQVGAFNSEQSAQNLVQRLRASVQAPIIVRHQQQPQTVFKVLLGPLRDNLELLALRNLLERTENIAAFVVYH